MEDGVKEEPVQSNEPKFLAKAGWLKKGQGRLLASYKDRYVHVEKTEVVVYEDEELQNCLERLDLENYDKCHELKSPFTKKHRLIVIRSPKSGNKVHDLKFQVLTAEEKEAWIKALTDGINRAKNKVFDEVKVDESSNLEHVTRTRPKGNRNRRPPTRIHMKEVADVSSDGILRLDLDLEDAVMPNGTHHTNVDGTDNRKEATVPTSLSTVSEAVEEQPNAEEEPQTEAEGSPQKKVIKPPMPPTKEVKPISVPEDETDKHDGPEKKVLKPPMPPSKESKPSTSSTEETPEATKAEMSEKSPDVKKKTGPPPTPPNKPTSQQIPHPPAPPSKDKKPSHPVVDPDQGTADEKEEKDEDNRNETTGAAKETDHSPSKEAIARGDKAAQANTQVSEEETGETLSKASSNEPLISISPEGQDITAPLETTSDNLGSSLQAEEVLPKTEVHTVVVSSNDPFSDNLSLSPMLCHLPGEKKKKAEEKSVDSGQHSDDDSEGSGSEDTLAASTAALRGSHAGLDVLDASEDNVQVSVNLGMTEARDKQQVTSKVFPCRRSVPTPPAKPSAKVRSASIGDLLSDSSTCIQVSKHTRPGAGSNRPPSDDVFKLENEVALEIEKTSELLSRVSQEGGDGEGMPEDLLNKAMEKLKMADNVLKEVRKLKLAKNLNNRKSW